ncbi:MAG: hypothetical protein M0C28_42365 [Candidatus Moduliflexus flocculans]|nr:hypothetical protein [Candidatus Moduliflexus flocculans]
MRRRRRRAQHRRDEDRHPETAGRAGRPRRRTRASSPGWSAGRTRRSSVTVWSSLRNSRRNTASRSS